MTQTIYLDVYFGFNFLMDFLVLLILGIIIKTKKHIARTVISAIIGGIYATIVLMLKLEGGITYFLTYMIMAEVLIVVAFGGDNLKANLRNIAILYSITFLLNGLLNLLYFNLENKNIVQGAQNTYYGKQIFLLYCLWE
ncbi:MAG: sigma-E processing peptidase SpoIIGA [Eubacterium sp.]